MPEPEYDLTITPAALQIINEFHKSHFPEEPLVVIIADIHPIGSVFVVEMYPADRAVDNPNFQRIFKKGYKGYPFDVYVDIVAQREGAVPARMKFDVGITTKGITTLVFKNPDFES